MRRILVVGATGPLRPAALRLARDGGLVLALARDTARLAALAALDDSGIVPVAADYQDLGRLEWALATVEPADAALVYAPTAAPAALQRLTAHVTGTVVHLLTSDAARPGAEPPRDDPKCIHLILGWHSDPSGSSRWHTPEEISAAALGALGSRRGSLLGTTRPWADRPPYDQERTCAMPI